MNYYLSDTHFGHFNCIRLCNRPFKSVDEMDNAMIENWNRKVTDKDTVYFLGDFSWYDKQKTESIIKQLNGKKIFILGNHDRSVNENLQLTVKKYLEIEDEGKKVILFHYPILEWNGFYRDSIHLYGHVHNSNKILKIKNAYNVSADVLDFEPKTLKEIIKKG